MTARPRIYDPSLLEPCALRNNLFCKVVDISINQEKTPYTLGGTARGISSLSLSLSFRRARPISFLRIINLSITLVKLTSGN